MCFGTIEPSWSRGIAESTTQFLFQCMESHTRESAATDYKTTVQHGHWSDSPFSTSTISAIIPMMPPVTTEVADHSSTPMNTNRACHKVELSSEKTQTDSILLCQRNLSQVASQWANPLQSPLVLTFALSLPRYIISPTARWRSPPRTARHSWRGSLSKTAVHQHSSKYINEDVNDDRTTCNSS